MVDSRWVLFLYTASVWMCVYSHRHMCVHVLVSGWWKDYSVTVAEQITGAPFCNLILNLDKHSLSCHTQHYSKTTSGEI